MVLRVATRVTQRLQRRVDSQCKCKGTDFFSVLFCVCVVNYKGSILVQVYIYRFVTLGNIHYSWCQLHDKQITLFLTAFWSISYYENLLLWSINRVFVHVVSGITWSRSALCENRSSIDKTRHGLEKKWLLEVWCEVWTTKDNFCVVFGRFPLLKPLRQSTVR